MSGILDKIAKLRATRPSNGGNRGARMNEIFHSWVSGVNRLRLVGEFLEVKTHFLPAVPKRRERGLCIDSAFDKNNENYIRKVINCPNWDIELEAPTKIKTCAICKLHDLSVLALKDDPDEKEKKYFEALKAVARARDSLKWNIFDRLNPNIIFIDDEGNEEKKKGLKIATIGMEAWRDIDGIFRQCALDLTDPKEGVDIEVLKDASG